MCTHGSPPRGLSNKIQIEYEFYTIEKTGGLRRGHRDFAWMFLVITSYTFVPSN